jgi:hypothetical protein
MVIGVVNALVSIWVRLASTLRLLVKAEMPACEQAGYAFRCGGGGALQAHQCHRWLGGEFVRYL